MTYFNICSVIFSDGLRKLTKHFSQNSRYLGTDWSRGSQEHDASANHCTTALCPVKSISSLGRPMKENRCEHTEDASHCYLLSHVM